MLRLLIAAVTIGVGLAACSAEEEKQGEYTGPLMRPGQDCLACHSADSGVGAPVWSAGGTVYAKADAKADEGVAGADVLLSAADGSLLAKLTTNAVGNFYTDKPLPAGFRVAVEYQGQRIEMPCSPPAGLCNYCHSDPPKGSAPGRIHVPQGADPDRPPFQCAGATPGMTQGMAGGGGAPAASAGAENVPNGGASAGSPASMAGAGLGGAAPAQACSGEASYQVTVDVTWADPAVDSRHFTTLIGGVHSSALSVWAPGGLATPGVQAMAESGNVLTLSSELEAAIAQGTALSVVKLNGGDAPGQRTTQVTVKPEFPLVSLGSMLAPTPDWFFGVSSLSLCESGSWLASKSVAGTVYDAGTKNGNGFDYGDGETNPHVAIAPVALFASPPASITFEKL